MTQLFDGVREANRKLDDVVETQGDIRERLARLEVSGDGLEANSAAAAVAIQDHEHRLASIEADKEADRRARKQVAVTAGTAGAAAIADLLHRLFGGG